MIIVMIIKIFVKGFYKFLFGGFRDSKKRIGAGKLCNNNLIYSVYRTHEVHRIILLLVVPCSLFPIPYSLLPIPYCLFSVQNF